MTNGIILFALIIIVIAAIARVFAAATGKKIPGSFDHVQQMQEQIHREHVRMYEQFQQQANQDAQRAAQEARRSAMNQHPPF